MKADDMNKISTDELLAKFYQLDDEHKEKFIAFLLTLLPSSAEPAPSALPTKD